MFLPAPLSPKINRKATVRTDIHLDRCPTTAGPMGSTGRISQSNRSKTTQCRGRIIGDPPRYRLGGRGSPLPVPRSSNNQRYCEYSIFIWVFKIYQIDEVLAGHVTPLRQTVDTPRGHTHTNGPSSPAPTTHIPSISHLCLPPTSHPCLRFVMSHPHPTLF